VETSLPRVGVIGLGAMGGQIAGHLLDAGHDVLGFDVREEAMIALAARGLRSARSSAQVARDADIVITSLPSEASLRDAATGDRGIGGAARPGLVVIETSTLDLEVKREVRGLLEPAGTEVLDCPLSGTSGQLAQRDVVVFASGAAETITRVLPVLGTFSRRAYDVGPFGNGSRLKLISNLLVTIHNVAAAEALGAAEGIGLDRATALAALADSAGTSRMLEIRGPMMVQGEYEPPHARLIDFMKDIALIAQLGRDIDLPLPLFSACVPIYEEAVAHGLGAVDHAVVAELLRRPAGPDGSPGAVPAGRA
jgi:3-hydroxyisobutyrate dehydrogenase-like beta-hydroxyacid dehydrogenase